MTRKSLVPALTFSIALAASVGAQGPPSGQPGNLRAAVGELADRVEALEARSALLESENAVQSKRLSAVELENGRQATQIASIEGALDRPDRTVPTGTVAPFAGPVSEVPDGWLLCDGSELGRSDFARLFAVIGTAHGAGDGVSTFRLPDYRGMFLRGVDQGRGLDPDRAFRGNFSGGNTGDHVGSVQFSAFARHGHSLGAFGLCDVGAPNGGLAPLVNILQPCQARTFSDGAGGNETRPANVYVHFIVKD